MEAKKEEFIVTQEWLEEMGACRDGLQAFKKHFPNGGEALEVLKRCEELGYEELDYIDFGEWLVDWLPPIYPPLVLNNLIGNLFYPGDVHIKGDVSTQDSLYSKGSLKVDGKLTVNGDGSIYSAKDCVTADEIDISRYAHIRRAQIKANRISLRDYARLSGDVIAKVVNLKGGYISGDVDADEIINDGGLIRGDVNTFTIENINGGRVKGKITYKRSDEHK